MKIIVLGATGYLGSRVVRKLLEQNHQILCLKRVESSMHNLEDILNGLQFCDIDDLEGFLGQCAQPYDCLINLACKYSSNAKDDMDIYMANLIVPLRVFLNCISNGVRKIITIGTGLPDEFNTYCISKSKFAELCKWYGDRYRADGNELQICNVELENYYGEGEPINRFIPATIDKLKRNEKILLTAGDQKRDFIYVGDAVRNIVKLVNMNSLPDYCDFPLGTGEGIPMREIIEYLKEITGSNSELCFGAIEKRMNEPDSFADCTKMMEYGLTAEYSWKEGFKKII